MRRVGASYCGYALDDGYCSSFTAAGGSGRVSTMSTKVMTVFESARGNRTKASVYRRLLHVVMFYAFRVRVQLCKLL